MAITGRCYCGALRYEVSADPVFKGQCHCRECQFITGGGPNIFMGVPAAAFRYTQGEPKAYSREDLDNPVTREFCPKCGTHMLTRLPNNPAVIVLKVGTLDDTSVYDGPQIAVWTDEMPPYHRIPEGVATFAKMPG